MTDEPLTDAERAALDSIDIHALLRRVTGETLEDQVKRLSATAMKYFKQAASEKQTRISYQDIVYQCCNIIDKHNGKKPGQGITIDQLPESILAVIVQVPASRDEPVERLTSELQAVNNHLDFAYQAIGLSKYSSEPLSEAIRRLRERAEAVVKCKRETVSSIPHRLLHWINFLEAALSPPPSTPEERSVET